MPPYDNQMFTLLYTHVCADFRAFLKERALKKRNNVHKSTRYVFWQRISKLGARKLGILLMRMGGKLIYWGTPLYTPPLPDEV